MKRLVVQCACLLLLLACGGGGTVGPTVLFEGGWFMTRTDSRTCGATPEVWMPVSFLQTGSTVMMTTPVETLTGSVAGDTARFAGPMLVVDPVTTDRASYTDIVLTLAGNTITGPATVSAPSGSSGPPATCEDTASLKLVPEMRLVGFNLDMALEAPSNLPLEFLFTQDVDPTSITPDTVQITGLRPPYFEATVADGNAFALIPVTPNFEDYTDIGMVPTIPLDVLLPGYLAPDSIRSTQGAPLVVEFLSTFTPGGNTIFVEPRRPLVHLPGPLATPPGRGDEDGCLNNPDNSLYTPPGFQTGTDASATLLCLVNEGPPRIVLDACRPTHDAPDVGMRDPTSGDYWLPALRIRINEPVRPDDVVQFDMATHRGDNVQLWRVGDAAGNPILITAANQVGTNKPIVVQNLEQTEVILVAIAPQPAGVYLVNVRGLFDLPGNPLVVIDRPDPAIGGYATIDASLGAVVPDGYRYYFRVP